MNSELRAKLKILENPEFFADFSFLEYHEWSKEIQFYLANSPKCSERTQVAKLYRRTKTKIRNRECARNSRTRKALQLQTLKEENLRLRRHCAELQNQINHCQCHVNYFSIPVSSSEQFDVV